MAPFNPSLVPNDFLTESDRVNRPQLGAWARSLLRRIESGDVAPGRWLNVSGCLNHASLIEVYRGNPRGARELCEQQLRCAENLFQFHDPATYAEFVLQPWINLGRLLRIQGQYALALEYFALYFDALLGASPRLWPLQSDVAVWRKHAEAQGLLRFALAVYVLDSTKTCFAARDVEGALRILERLRSLPQAASSLLLDEAQLLTLFKLGRHDEAMALTERDSWLKEGFHGKLVRVTYRVALLAASGSLDTARKLGLQLSERVLAVDWSAPKDPCSLRYLSYFGQLLREVGEPQVAARVWQAGLRGTHHLADVPLQLSLLDALLALEAPPERDVLAAEREALLRDCLYVPLLKSRGLPVEEPAGAADPVFEQVRGHLERIMRASAPAPREEPEVAAVARAANS